MVTKVLYCNDLVPGCKFEARGSCDEEVIAEYADHIAMAHHMFEISDQVLEMISKAIHDEVHVRSRAARA
jgi:predicted small metal-binding protein